MNNLILSSILIVSVSIFGAAALDMSYLFFRKQGWLRPSGSAATLVFLIALLMGFLCVFVFSPSGLTFTSLLYYGSGAWLYTQCKSLFSRGYSIRILADLGKEGASASIESLKSNYGKGLGISGMITKRFGSMSALHLLNLSGTHVGPLTAGGTYLAVLGFRIRQILRLDKVG